MTVIPPDPGPDEVDAYLASALEARPDIDADEVHRKVARLVEPEPGKVRDAYNVKLDIAGRLWHGQTWADVLDSVPRD